MSDIFISYTNADRPGATILVGGLEQQGWSVWWDRAILPGKAWDKVIEEALDNSRCVVVLWSQHSIRSDWVRTEAEEAKGRGILVPVLLDRVNIPLAFRGIHAANLAEWGGQLQSPAFAELVRAVSEVLSYDTSSALRAAAPSNDVTPDIAVAPGAEQGHGRELADSFAPEKPATKIVPAIAAFDGAATVTSTANVALVWLEVSVEGPSLVQVMARALDAIAHVNVEVLALSTTNHSQGFSFLVPDEELGRTVTALESELALELAHGYVKPIMMDKNVGLLAVVGEGLSGRPDLPGRILTAISHEGVNISAIARGPGEPAIAIAVSRGGLERAARAARQECALGPG